MSILTVGQAQVEIESVDLDRHINPPQKTLIDGTIYPPMDCPNIVAQFKRYDPNTGRNELPSNFSVDRMNDEQKDACRQEALDNLNEYLVWKEERLSELRQSIAGRLVMAYKAFFQALEQIEYMNGIYAEIDSREKYLPSDYERANDAFSSAEAAYFRYFSNLRWLSDAVWDYSMLDGFRSLGEVSYEDANGNILLSVVDLGEEVEEGRFRIDLSTQTDISAELIAPERIEIPNGYKEPILATVPILPTAKVVAKHLGAFVIECSAEWDEDCNKEETVRIPEGWKYCEHYPSVVTQYGDYFYHFLEAYSDRVVYELYASGSYLPFDKWGSVIRLKLDVYGVEAGTSCPRRGYAPSFPNACVCTTDRRVDDIRGCYKTGGACAIWFDISFEACVSDRLQCQTYFQRFCGPAVGNAPTYSRIYVPNSPVC